MFTIDLKKKNDENTTNKFLFHVFGGLEVKPASHFQKFTLKRKEINSAY